MIIDNNPRFDLAPYHEDDGRVFGGRDKTIKDLMNFIVRNHFVVLNGQAGIGKTSLIMAGIIGAPGFFRGSPHRPCMTA